MKKINDFGTKIGGAKKDIYALMSNGEFKKSVIWKCPSYAALEEKGIPQLVLFWRHQMRAAFASTGKTEFYVETCVSFRDSVNACESMEDIESFYKNDILKYFEKKDEKKYKYLPGIKDVIDGVDVLRYLGHPERIEADMKVSNFMKEKYEIFEVNSENLTVSKTKNRYANKIKTERFVATIFHREDFSTKGLPFWMVINKAKFVGIYKSEKDAKEAVEALKNKKRAEKKAALLPPHLDHIERTGSDYRSFRMSDGNVLVSRYGLRGGEFGNYTTSKDRMGSINMAYDAFEDLYKALDISPKDISLGGDLAIAFGARGKGNAMAHYEPERNVINITKIRGAGSLAHEWGHAADMYIGNKFGAHGYISANLKAAPESAKKLVDSFMKKEDGTVTDFYAASKAFDKEFCKTGNGYWASNHEMFARAFACYIKDKIDGKSDYLVGHAECAAALGMSGFPVGEERKRINKCFDEFFEDMIDKGLFSRLEKGEEKKANIIDVDFFESEDGQLKFC